MLTVIVPTRGRPANLARLSEAVARTAAPGTKVLARVDDDDPELQGYWGVAERLPNIDLRVGPRIRFAASANELAALVETPYLAVLGDDVLPETAEWDRLMVGALGGSLGVAYGSDGLEHLHGVELPTHVVVPTELYNRLGWVVLPALRHLFADNVWRELGKALGNFPYLPEVKLTHLHRWVQLAPDDQTYREANESDKREQDRRAFEVWRDGAGYREALTALGLVPVPELRQ